MEPTQRITEVLKERLRVALADNNIRQTELADACGISRAAIAGWLKTGQISTEHLPTVARTLNRSLDWLFAIDPIAHVSDAQGSYDTHLRTLPLRDDLTNLDTPPPPNGPRVACDPEMAMKYTTGAFATHIRDDAMSPIYTPGDVVLADRQTIPRPGDVVIALLNDHVLIQTYKPRSITNLEEFDLIPSNNFYPHTPISSRKAILATVIEHHRRVR